MRRLFAHLLPGAPLVIEGKLLFGVLLGLSFSIVANFAIVAWLILPAEFSWEIRVGATLLAATVIPFGALLRRSKVRARTLKGVSPAVCAVERRIALTELVRAIEDGGIAESAFQKLQLLGETDLHVAYQLARYAEAAGDHRAGELHERLRVLDRHKIYSSANTQFDANAHPN